MPLEQIIVLAVVQGITEFLPISSSGHLILIPFLTGWPDQGQFTDVMTHLGTLLAVLIYFWRDVWRLTVGVAMLLRGKVTDDGRLALYILIGTIPAVLFGAILSLLDMPDLERNVTVVAWNTVIFGLLMLIADTVGRQVKTVGDVTLRDVVVVGIAQAMALIPGTSRSGITMTAARFLGFTRPDSARFSFLLGIPATAAAIVLTLGKALKGGCHITSDELLAAGLTFVAGILAIAFLMGLLKRISLLPFVLYRMALGGFLLVLIYGYGMHLPAETQNACGPGQQASMLLLQPEGASRRS
jgi:undecaprenyl-diphosphatase